MSKVKNFLFPPSVNSVLSTFTKAMDELNDVADYHQVEGDRKNTLISDLQMQMREHDNEVMRAHAVRTKLEALLK